MKGKILDWQAVAIEEVCERFSLDKEQWLAKKDEGMTICEFFGVLNKVCK